MRTVHEYVGDGGIAKECFQWAESYERVSDLKDCLRWSERCLFFEHDRCSSGHGYALQRNVGGEQATHDSLSHVHGRSQTLRHARIQRLRESISPRSKPPTVRREGLGSTGPGAGGARRNPAPWNTAGVLSPTASAPGRSGITGTTGAYRSKGPR